MEARCYGSRWGRAASPVPAALDTVITGAIIIDHWGIIKADIGIRDGRIVGIGKAGNPDIMDGVDPALIVGPSTEIIAGNNRIVTAGGIDCHVHFICPQILPEALSGGITTMIGGGTGPAEGSKATTVTPGAWHLGRMLQALDGWPMNILMLGKGIPSIRMPCGSNCAAAQRVSNCTKIGEPPRR